VTREELRTALASLPGATSEYPLDETTRVYKVGGKIFAMADDIAEPLSVTLKCHPDLAEELREQHPKAVAPGYYMNKRHWNTVTPNDSVSDDDLRDWLAHSYDLVFRSLPKSARAEILPPNRDGSPSH